MWALLNPVLSNTSGRRKIRRPEEPKFAEFGLAVNDGCIVDFLGTVWCVVDWWGHSIRQRHGSHFNCNCNGCTEIVGYRILASNAAVLESANIF